MHKLNLYINDDRLEKLKLMTGETDIEKIEEFLNEAIYEAIAMEWIGYKAADLQYQLETGDYEEETKQITIEGIEYEIWSDGNMAAISFDDYDFTVQIIESKMCYVLSNGRRVACTEDSQNAVETLLKEASVEIKNFTMEELGNPIIYKGEEA